jgi:hypothetical protein
MTRLKPITLTAILVVALLAGAAAPAAAEHDDGDSSTLGEVLDAPADALGYARGLAEGALSRASYAINGPEDDAATNRDDAIDAFNQHNTSLIQYANARNVHEGEVARIDCTIEDETATAYIVADYNSTSGEYESAKAVTSTDRTVDHTVELRGAACDNAAAEIERFDEEFASQDKDVTKRYLAQMASKYGGSVDEPFTEDN